MAAVLLSAEVRKEDESVCAFMHIRIYSPSFYFSTNTQYLVLQNRIIPMLSCGLGLFVFFHLR